MKAFAFGLGIAAGLIIIPLAIVEAINALTGDEPLEPLCDGEFTDSEEIEGDGFITVYCSGPIRTIQS
jgi:hypothetical protein